VFFIGQQCVAGTSGLVSQVPAAAAGGGELGHGREELGSTACRGGSSGAECSELLIFGSTACRDEKTSEEAQDSWR